MAGFWEHSQREEGNMSSAILADFYTSSKTSNIDGKILVRDWLGSIFQPFGSLVVYIVLVRRIMVLYEPVIKEVSGSSQIN